MTKHSKLRFISVLIVAVILLLCAVIVTKSRPKGYENTAFAMDTYVSETIYGAKSSGVLSYIDELDKKLSAYNKDSEIYKLNESGSLNVSLDTLSLINEGIKYTNDCDGIFDISLFPVTSLWGIGTDNPKVPKSEEIETALKSVGIENITVDDNTVTLKNGAGIDLGGIAKGYACDKAYEI